LEELGDGIMNPSLRRQKWIGLLCLWLAPAYGLAQDKQEADVPQGYEDAEVADEARPAVDVPVEDGGALIDVLVGALEENPDPNVANLERQYLPQFQRLLKPEVAFIRRVCQPNEEQHSQIVKSADQRLRLAVREYAIAQNNMRRPRVIGFRARSMPDPRKLVQQQLAKLVKLKLSAEQAKAYQQECDKRNAHRKHATVLSLVAKLDQELVLTAEQRGKLIESLSSNWEDGWLQSLQILVHNHQYLPNLPDSDVVPFLNETQKTIWRGSPKHSITHWGGFGHAPAMVVIDDGDMEAIEFVIEEPQ